MLSLQPVRQLARILDQLANVDHYLFTLSDLQAAIPGHPKGAFKTLISRAEKNGLLKRVCRGVYLYPRVTAPPGLLLFHVAALLRADAFNYISLETALSDAGIISQISINWITIMSSGRSNIIRCGEWGTIEFVHTSKKPNNLTEELKFDCRCRLWRASVKQAIRDMKSTGRNLDLIDWSGINDSL